MDRRTRWAAFRGRAFIVIGIVSLCASMFFSEKIPEALEPMVVVFGVGFILLAVPRSAWVKLPAWFHKDDSWL